MQERHSEIGKILAKYPAITAEEEAILKEWRDKSRNQLIFDELTDEDYIIRMLEEFERMKQGEAESWTKLQNAMSSFPAQADEEVPERRKLSWWYYTAAASVLLVISSLFLFKWYSSRQDEVSIPKSQPVAKNNDVLPGQFKAKLTLADGSVMVLDTIFSSQLVQQGSTTVYTRGGQLMYEQKGKHKEVLYNTLTTAKGETYGMVLSDGSKIWLNAQSSLRYPVAFTGDERKVEITGEAYFEIASLGLPPADSHRRGERKMPFVVSLNGMEVEVLGTKFNINSYSDEDAIKTTLLEGKVKVRSAAMNAQTVLAPGEQALLNKGTQLLNKTKDIDVKAEVAWRFGLFQFNNADLRTVMHQLEKWYDVQVSYEGNIKNGGFEFLGKLPRNMNLSQVLSILQKQDVHFKIEGKKIIVTP